MAITTPHAEIWPWPRGQWREGEFWGQRKLICTWNNMAALANEIGNYPESAWPVSAYPWGTADALARQIRYQAHKAEQLSETGFYNDYEFGELLVDYSTIGPRYFGGDLITETLSITDEVYPMDYTRLCWDNAINGEPLRANDAPDRVYHGIRYSITYHQLLSVPENILLWIGFINNNPVASPTLNGVSFAERTLLYRGPIIKASHRIGMLSSYEVTYEFDYRPFNRQHVWRVGKLNPDGLLGWYDEVFVKGLGALKPYRETAF